ncbi:hypothetical protein PQ465_02005 [Sphingobacterium oryzagri]|uniref:Uncharacterized protein n=1 Tax=Sphingobacterium oryzagri TaxID=3025669 RepID=A0ABY7WHT3_9SPHI|nr:hypothetical protein [Sphingobacterium sp. KACC 22765]WDF69166.1 hypothetical protein PQ465_02005 [Sphingobacterium sp. KACC 22765]
MKALLLLVISCCLLLFGAQEASYKTASGDNAWVSLSKNFHYFHNHHSAKKTRIKKSSPLHQQQQDGFTESDEDFSFNRHLELQVRELLVFTIAFVWAARFVLIKMPLPFAWSSAASIPSKYILQRVLRI